jgi:hypothetical protein
VQVGYHGQRVANTWQRMSTETANVMRLSLPGLTRLDGRSAPARRIKVVAARLKREADIGRRWSDNELDLLTRTAVAVVLAEECQRRALQGDLPVPDAILASNSARRATRDLRAMLERNTAEPALGPLGAVLRQAIEGGRA